MCGALRAADAGKKAVLMGWVNKRRDHGSLLFVDLRDRTGVTQVVFNADRDARTHEKAGGLRNEYVIAVTGTVKLRDANTINPNMPTGQVELVADELRILNESKLPPFLPSDTALTNEEISGSEPRAARDLLRIAAVSPDVQADPDDLRVRQVLPDCSLLP
jgi:aspartyl-tRNA synthetase